MIRPPFPHKRRRATIIRLDPRETSDRMHFSDLGLSDEVLRAVGDAGYTTPTPIQEQAIPIVLTGRDILGCAQTGTGKTASFTLPMIDILAKGRAKARMPRSLILEPTRELAAQVAENFVTYGKYNKLTKALLIGGESLADQVKVVDRGVDVLIATPGRLLDLFERGRLLLRDVKILVIDEADRMLDMGFIPDVEKIVSLIPKIRQTLFFSATMPPEIKRLADAFLTNPKQISVAKPASTADTITQGVVIVRHQDGKRPGGGQKEKRAALRNLMRREPVKNALIFCNRKRDVGVVCRSLTRHGFNAGQLHGDMAQPARMETLGRFKKGEIQFLVCSDVAARGLDIQEMSHVFNFDLPTHAEDYVHRIGRTGRAGREGRAFSIATPEEGKYLSAIEKLIGKPIPRITLEGIDEAQVNTESADDADSADEKRGRRPRGRRGEKTREERAAPVPVETNAEATAEDAAPPTAMPEAAPAPQNRQEPRQNRADEGREHHRDRGQDRNRDRNERKSHDDDRPVKGLGDHMPAFLMRAPVPTNGD